MANGGISGNEFARMQKEAERRVMDMQRKAQTKIHEPPTIAAKHDPPPPPPTVQPSQNRSFLDLLNIKSFLESKDTSLVLMVLALLGRENTDPLLMLALLYIVM